MPMSADQDSSRFPYACTIDVSFPTSSQAERTTRVLQVDKEISDRVVKTISWKEGSCVMNVRFEAQQAKLLRVAVSSFYDYLTVSLKTLQEFDPTA